MNVALGVGFAALAALPARGQESISYSWRFVEVVAGTDTPVANPDGLIQPGESARLELTATVLPGIGAPATFTPPPQPGYGTIGGLGSVFFDVVGTNIQGAWAYIDRAPGFRLGPPGTPDPSGIVYAAEAGQYIFFGGIANTANPVFAIWHGVWTPSSYLPHTTTFTSTYTGRGNQSSSILILYGSDPESGFPLYAARFVDNNRFNVQIPIAPVPSVLPAIGALALLGPWRTRPRT